MSQQRRTYNQRQALSRYEERRRQEEARREMLQRRREKEQESRELAKGPIDLPFCLLVLLLTAVGSLQLGFFYGVDLLEVVVIADIAVQLLIFHVIDDVDHFI